MYTSSAPLRRNLSATLSIALAMTLTLGLTASTLLAPAFGVDRGTGFRMVAEDDEVVLPGVVAAAIARTEHAVDRAEAAIDDRRTRQALLALTATIENLRRTTRIGLAQMNAAPADPEAETTPGPDSVVAVLTLHQGSIIRLSGLFDNLRRPKVISRLNRAMVVAHRQRLLLLNAVIALDPEGAGADYADGMADTVDSYADEVAAIAGALTWDRLTPQARKILQYARSRSVVTQAKVTAAFGGGE